MAVDYADKLYDGYFELQEEQATRLLSRFKQKRPLKPRFIEKELQFAQEIACFGHKDPEKRHAMAKSLAYQRVAFHKQRVADEHDAKARRELKNEDVIAQKRQELEKRAREIAEKKAKREAREGSGA